MCILIGKPAITPKKLQQMPPIDGTLLKEEKDSTVAAVTRRTFSTVRDAPAPADLRGSTVASAAEPQEEDHPNNASTQEQNDWHGTGTWWESLDCELLTDIFDYAEDLKTSFWV